MKPSSIQEDGQAWVLQGHTTHALGFDPAPWRGEIVHRRSHGPCDGQCRWSVLSAEGTTSSHFSIRVTKKHTMYAQLGNVVAMSNGSSCKSPDMSRARAATVSELRAWRSPCRTAAAGLLRNASFPHRDAAGHSVERRRLEDQPPPCSRPGRPHSGPADRCTCSMLCML